MLHIKLAQFAVRCALPPRRSESPVCATVNKPSCVLHLLGWFIGSHGFSSFSTKAQILGLTLYILVCRKSAVVDLDNSYFLQSWKYFVAYNILLSNVKLREKSELRKKVEREQRDWGNERGKWMKNSCLMFVLYHLWALTTLPLTIKIFGKKLLIPGLRRF